MPPWRGLAGTTVTQVWAKIMGAASGSKGADQLTERPDAFHDQFVALFGHQFQRLFRYLDRMTGEPELAADLAQEAFIRLYRRGALPDVPEAWLVSVALNLFRNESSTRSRRRRLLTVTRGEASQADPPPAPDQVVMSREAGDEVRATLDQMAERDRGLLLLWAEGYSYQDMAVALELNEASVGTLLARARRAFRETYGAARDAS